MTQQYKVSLWFIGLSYTALPDYTDTVIIGFADNAGLPHPPVSMPDLETQKQTYLLKQAATAQGGTVATAERNDAWQVLTDSLRQLAAYVQTVAANDLTLLLSSGFQPVSTNRAQAPLDTPLIVGIDYGLSGQLLLRAQSVRNARAYEVQFKNGTGGWQPAGIATQARRIEINDLTPGNTYSVQLRAIGGSTGYSDWSDPVSRMAV